MAYVTACAAAEVAGAEVLGLGVRALWPAVPGVVGPAHIVQAAPADNLMVHAAIYRANPGDVLVVKSADVDFALVGGNVCALAQSFGIAGLVTDGVVRDLAEIMEMGFPVFARGTSPIPGRKDAVLAQPRSVNLAGVTVFAGDIIVADVDGVVVLPAASATDMLQTARAKQDREATQTLAQWGSAHRAKVEEALRRGGDVDPLLR